MTDLCRLGRLPVLEHFSMATQFTVEFCQVPQRIPGTQPRSCRNILVRKAIWEVSTPTLLHYSFVDFIVNLNRLKLHLCPSHSFAKAFITLFFSNATSI